LNENVLDISGVWEVDLKIHWDVTLKGQQQVLWRNGFRWLTTASHCIGDESRICVTTNVITTVHCPWSWTLPSDSYKNVQESAHLESEISSILPKDTVQYLPFLEPLSSSNNVTVPLQMFLIQRCSQHDDSKLCLTVQGSVSMKHGWSCLFDEPQLSSTNHPAQMTNQASEWTTQQWSQFDENYGLFLTQISNDAVLRKEIILLLIVVLPCILISSKPLCQQMHSLLQHKMLQLTLKISLYMAPTYFGPFGPSSGSIWQNLAKVTVFVEIISKNTSLKLLLCCGNMCFSL
jgi:hypothetical protein